MFKLWLKFCLRSKYSWDYYSIYFSLLQYIYPLFSIMMYSTLPPHWNCPCFCTFCLLLHHVSFITHFISLLFINSSLHWSFVVLNYITPVWGHTRPYLIHNHLFYLELLYYFSAWESPFIPMINHHVKL